MAAAGLLGQPRESSAIAVLKILHIVEKSKLGTAGEIDELVEKYDKENFGRRRGN